MLKNIPKNRIIAKDRVFFTSELKKTLGLIFRKIKDKAYIFTFKKETRMSLHMFFVFSAIDLIFLSKNKEVIEIKRNFRPFTFYKPKNRYRYVIELKKGKAEDTEIGDRLEF